MQLAEDSIFTVKEKTVVPGPRGQTSPFAAGDLSRRHRRPSEWRAHPGEQACPCAKTEGSLQSHELESEQNTGAMRKHMGG